MKFISHSHIGKVKKNNQDSIGHKSSPLGNLFIICDGVSGLPNGKRASDLAVNTLLHNFMNIRTNSIKDDEILKNIFEKTQETIIRDSTKPMGTTVAACLIKNNSVFAAWCGDSRIYHFKKNSIEWMTMDHNVLHDVLNKGQGNSIHYQNPKALNRFFGKRILVKSEYYQFDVETNDYILICTDGLSDFIHETEILSIITKNTLEEASNIMNNKLLSKNISAPDNFSWYIIKIKEHK